MAPVGIDSPPLGTPQVLKTTYKCYASVQPQPYEIGDTPASTGPWYDLWTDYEIEWRNFYEHHKDLPYCKIVSEKSMKRSFPNGTSYWTDYEILYCKRDGWLNEPVIGFV